MIYNISDNPTPSVSVSYQQRSWASSLSWYQAMQSWVGWVCTEKKGQIAIWQAFFTSRCCPEPPFPLPPPLSRLCKDLDLLRDLGSFHVSNLVPKSYSKGKWRGQWSALTSKLQWKVHGLGVSYDSKLFTCAGNRQSSSAKQNMGIRFAIDLTRCTFGGCISRRINQQTVEIYLPLEMM